MPPLKFFVPNAFTALSLLLGLASVTMSVEGNFELAAWMILWGTLLDKLDGSAARLFKATSKFGVEFDSFADFVSFGIAPAALIYFRLLGTGHWEGWYRTALMASTGLYVLALAVRLARFNVVASEAPVFYGVPGTLMGAVVAGGYLTFANNAIDEAALTYCPAFLVIFAVMMVSNLRLPKLKVRKSKPLNVFQFGNVALGYIFGPLMIFPEYLFGLAITYLVGGLIVGALVPPDPQDDVDEDEDEPVAVES